MLYRLLYRLKYERNIMRILAVFALSIFTLSACQNVNMPTHKKYAAVLLDDGIKQTEILGFVRDSGKIGLSEPFIFSALSGNVVCRGTYNMTGLYQPGKIYLDCFNGRIKGTGVFEVKGLRNGKSYGIAQVKTAKENVRIVYGLTAQEFEARRLALAKK